ncbi:MAG: hypothetical protein UHJ46_07255 [Treponema sp.]|nr:hypothetical protein [Treponema sp.]
MIIFQISRFEMKSVDVQRDNLLKAQLSFRGPRFPLNFEIRNSYIKFPLRLLKNMLVKLKICSYISVTLFDFFCGD